MVGARELRLKLARTVALVVVEDNTTGAQGRLASGNVDRAGLYIGMREPHANHTIATQFPRL